MTQIPDGLPTLAGGKHRPSDGKACVMEYVALLAGEEWTDTPSCTHPIVAYTARMVNDGLDDHERHVLVPLIGRLFGANEESPRVWAVLDRFFAQWGYHRAFRGYNLYEPNALGPYKVVWTVNDLTQLLDMYDEVTGRTTSPVPDETLRELATTVSARKAN